MVSWVLSFFSLSLSFFFFCDSFVHSSVGRSIRWSVLLCMGEWILCRNRKFKFQAFVSVQYSSFVCSFCCRCSTTTGQWSFSLLFFLVEVLLSLSLVVSMEYEWQMWISLLWSVVTVMVVVVVVVVTGHLPGLAFVDAADVSWCCHVTICMNVHTSTGWMPGLAGTSRQWRLEYFFTYGYLLLFVILSIFDITARSANIHDGTAPNNVQARPGVWGIDDRR